MDWRNDEWTATRDVLATVDFESEVQTNHDLEEQSHDVMHELLRER